MKREKEQVFMNARRIKFSKHASEKFGFLRRYGFLVTEAFVKDTIVHPNQTERRNDQILAIRPLDDEHALRVVYKRINDNILVVTFYPVRRERFHV